MLHFYYIFGNDQPTTYTIQTTAAPTHRVDIVSFDSDATGVRWIFLQSQTLSVL
jgi:hypothetical protein